MKKFIVRSDESTDFDKNAIEAVLRSFPFATKYVSEVIPKPYGLVSHFSTPKNPIFNSAELPEILKVEDVARFIGLSKQTVYRLCKSDDFPAFRPKGTAIYLIPKEKLLAWVASEADKPQW